MKTNNKSNEDDDGNRKDKIIKDLPSAMYSVRRAVIEECVRSDKPSLMTTAAMTADDQYDDDDNDDNNDDDNNDNDG